MASSSTLSGHLVIEAGEAVDAARRVLAELPAAADSNQGSLSRDAFSEPSGVQHGDEVAFSFAMTTEEIDDLDPWLERFEELLARVDEASGGPAIRRALLVLESPSHEHPTAVAGLHVYHWLHGSEGDLGVRHDDVLAPGFAERHGGDRLAAFVQGVAESGVVYGLRGDGWARLSDDGGRTRIPFWADAGQAARAARGVWAEHVPKAIELDAWLDEWLPGMVEDGIEALVSPRGPDDSEARSAADLHERISAAVRRR